MEVLGSYGLMGITCQFCEMKSVLQMDDDDGCTMT